MRPQNHGRVSGLRINKPIGAINPETFPIQVVGGDIVTANRVQFGWQGPAMQLYLCWGLKNAGNFSNGNDLLPAHNFASALVNVPDSPNTMFPVDVSIDARLTIPYGEALPGFVRDTYIWLAYSASDIETNFVTLADSSGNYDEDNRVIEITELSAVAKAENLEISYVKV